MLNKWRVSLAFVLILLSPWLSFFDRTLYSAHIVVIALITKSIFDVFKEKSFQKVVEFNYFVNRLLPFSFIIFIVFLTLMNGISSINKYTFIYLFEVLLMLVLIGNIRKPQILKICYNIFCCFTIFVAIIGILEATTDFRLPLSLYMLRDFSIYNKNKLDYMMSQPTALYFNPNDFSTLLVLGYGLFLGKYKQDRSNIRIVACLLLIIIGVVLSSSRANLLSIFLVTFIFIFNNFTIKDIKKMKLPIKLFSLVLLFIMLIIFKDQLFKIISQTYDAFKSIITGSIDNNPYHSNKERWKITVSGISVVLNNPLGVGPGNSRKMVGEMIGTSSADMHNWLLEIAADMGVIFLIFYLLYITKCIINVLRIAKQTRRPIVKAMGYGLIYSFLGMTISIIAPSSLIYFIPFWVMTAMLICYVNIFINFANCMEVER